MNNRAMTATQMAGAERTAVVNPLPTRGSVGPRPSRVAGPNTLKEARRLRFRSRQNALQPVQSVAEAAALPPPVNRDPPICPVPSPSVVVTGMDRTAPISVSAT